MKLIIALTVLSLTAVAHAEQKTIAAGKLTFDAPEGWKVEADGDGYSLVGPQDDIMFLMALVDAKQVKQALSNVDVVIAKLATDVKWAGKPKEAQSNGMPALLGKATGKVQGKDAKLAVLVLKPPVDKVLIMIGAVEAAKEKGYAAVVKKLIDSIKPIK